MPMNMDDIAFLVILGLIVLIAMLIKKAISTGSQEESDTPQEREKSEFYNENIENELKEVNKEIEQIAYIKKAYTPKWLFTYNEKDAYYKINKIAQKYNLKVFAKVRLLDLVTPVKSHQKFKTNLWKIQAKHVDFVLTTESLVAKYIIELDDNSHDTDDRKERDKFVDLVLTACGYKVLHTRGIKEEEIQMFIEKGSK